MLYSKAGLMGGFSRACPLLAFAVIRLRPSLGLSPW